MRARPALGRANGVAPVSPSEPAKRTRTESTLPTEHVTIADRTLVGFAATAAFDTLGLSFTGASPSRQPTQQTSTRTSRNERFMISATGSWSHDGRWHIRRGERPIAKLAGGILSPAVRRATVAQDDTLMARPRNDRREREARCHRDQAGVPSAIKCAARRHPTHRACDERVWGR